MRQREHLPNPTAPWGTCVRWEMLRSPPPARQLRPAFRLPHTVLSLALLLSTPSRNLTPLPKAPCLTTMLTPGRGGRGCHGAAQPQPCVTTHCYCCFSLSCQSLMRCRRPRRLRVPLRPPTPMRTWTYTSWRWWSTRVSWCSWWCMCISRVCWRLWCMCMRSVGCVLTLRGFAVCCWEVLLHSMAPAEHMDAWSA